MTNPETVQILVVVEVRVTVRPDVADGATVWVAPPTVIDEGVPNVTVCAVKVGVPPPPPPP